MNRKLRFSLVALLALFGMHANAQELTIDLTSNDGWNFPTDYVKTAASYSKDGVTLSFSESSNGHKFNEKDHYVIFGKQGATITFSAFSFDVERIDIIGREGASAATLQNIYVGDEAVSTETTGATATNQYKIAEGKQAAGTIYTLKVNSNHNTQLTKILIWKKGTSTDPDPVPEPEVQNVNVAKALEIVNALDNGAKTTDKYLVKGYIVGAPDFQRKADGTLYGNVNFTMADEKGGTTTLTVFRAKSFENANFDEETISLLKEGDLVEVQGLLQKYVNDDVTTPELVSGNLISVNGKDAASINAIKTDMDANAPAYNLKGQRIDAGYRGVVIRNGKKFFNQ